MSPVPRRTDIPTVSDKIHLSRASSRQSLEELESHLFEIEADTIAEALETAVGRTLTDEQSEVLYHAVAEDGGEHLEETLIDRAGELLEASSAAEVGDAAALIERIHPEVEAKLEQQEALYEEFDRRVLSEEIYEATGLELADEQVDRLLEALDFAESEQHAALVFDALIDTALSVQSRYGASGTLIR